MVVGRIQEKVALITGGSRGIGAATARLFAKEGAKVLIADILAKEGLALAEEIGGEFHVLDVADEGAWQSTIQQIKAKHGRLDILFNNAGIIGFSEGLGPQDPEQCSLASWHHVHQVNLDGVFLGCKYGILLMKEKGGSIVNMSSRSGVVGIPSASAYASSKAAIRNHTKSVALYCAAQGYGIRCNSVHPGAVLTAIWDPMLGPEDSRESQLNAVRAGIPLGDMGEPMDVAYAVLYLASEESKYITGTELTIDGGILAGSPATFSKQGIDER